MLILCKAWAPRRRLCDVQCREGKLHFFPCKTFYFCPSVENINIFLCLRKGEDNFNSIFLNGNEWRCKSFYLRAQGNQSNIHLQLLRSWGLQLSLNERHISQCLQSTSTVWQRADVWGEVWMFFCSVPWKRKCFHWAWLLSVHFIHNDVFKFSAFKRRFFISHRISADKQVGFPAFVFPSLWNT